MVTVNPDPYPGAPGESGSITNIAKLLGVGAYTIDDTSQGSGLNYGQDVGSDTFVKSLIYSTAMGMGPGDGTISSALTNMTTFLGTMPLDSLKLLQPFIPGATDADFADPTTAVNKIISLFNIGAGMLSVDDFNNWVESLLTPWAELWKEGKDWWDTVFAQLATYPPVGSSAATVATWWSTLLVDLGLGGSDAAAIANFISGNYDAAVTAKANWDAFLVAIGLSPAQIATAIANSTASINAFLAAIGLGSMTAAGAQIAGTTTTVGTQGNWWTRITQDVAIFCDLMHKTYPAGAATDTPTTTIGGVRTWYSAIADFLSLFSTVHSVATPAAAIADVGTFAQDTQTQVVTNESTLATVQAQVDALTTADPSVAGRKWVVPAHGGGGASWGPDWTVSATNANIAPKSNNDVYAMTLNATSAVDLKLTGLYANVTLTNQQIVSGVFYQAAPSMVGGNGPRNTFKGRMNAAGTQYVYLRVDYNVVSLGYATGGVEQTPWATVSMNVPAGALVELYMGSSAGDRNYQVKVNGTVVMTWAEVGTSSGLGASNLGGGQDMLASHGAFNDTFAPAQIRQFTLKDSNVAAVTYGTSARWYRATTSPKVYTNPASPTVSPINGLTTLVFDTEDYRAPDLHINAGGFSFDTAGRYRMQATVRFSAAQATTMTMALIRATPGGPSIVAEGVNYNTASMWGMEGNFEFNTIGDSGATEAFYIGIDAPGFSRTYGVVGDGVGLSTWITITRIA